MNTSSSLIARFWEGWVRASRFGAVRKRRAAKQPRLEALEGRVVLSAGYKITDLGTLGGQYEATMAINDHGQVVGWSFTAGNQYEYAYLSNHGKLKSLGSLTLGGGSQATGINDRGQIVGFEQNSALTRAEIILYDHGKMKNLGEMTTIPSVVAINNRDQIIGFSTQAGDAELMSGGRLKDLGSLKGLGSVALGMNNHGTVVGYSALKLPSVIGFNPITDPLPDQGPHASPPIEELNPGIQHAFVYRNGHMTDLGTLGGSSSEAMAVNNHGDVVGWSNVTGDAGKHAFLDHNGTMTDLGTLGGYASGATAINDKGQVVGWSYLAGNSQVDSFLYQDGTMVDLSKLVTSNTGLTLDAVVGINNHGQIAAVGGMPDGSEVALILTPNKTPRNEPIVAM
jgi:probable HAF family extracellular repeat protein